MSFVKCLRLARRHDGGVLWSKTLVRSLGSHGPAGLVGGMRYGDGDGDGDGNVGGSGNGSGNGDENRKENGEGRGGGGGALVSAASGNMSRIPGTAIPHATLSL